MRVGRFDLPEPTRTPPPPDSVLAQEASAVTYNWDTNTLFIVGDRGTSIVQVSKTGQLIDSMTLAPGSSPQGTTFFDPEGLAYVGSGRFVMVEERDRQAVQFTYAAGTTLTRGDAQTVKLGTLVDNIGLEGITSDPLTNGFIAVKEISPQGIFQTGIDFAAGTATNGSPTTENSIDLFDPALASLLDFADVFALSNLPSLTGPESSHLLVLSQEAGRIVNVDRNGSISSSLTIVSDPGNPLSVPDQGHEGLTMDRDGILYVVSENGGGDSNHPQLWVYAPSSEPNHAPTAVALNNQINSIAENTSTASRLKVADVAITDDGLGTNNLSVTGADANAFDVDSNGLYIKAGTVLDFETRTSYSVTVEVDDATVGGSPDATADFSLAVTDIVDENPSIPSVFISEISPWSSGNSPYAADWFELKNTGATAVNVTGWRMDDDSGAFGTAVALQGITIIAAGESVIFIETANLASTRAAFLTAWFGANPPAGLQIGSYSGGGVGLSTGGDSVHLFDANGNRVTGVSFGASTTGFTFDNAAGLGSTTLPLPTISRLSVAGLNGAFVAADGVETGSPGTIHPDVTPPVIDPVDDIVAEATGPAGAIVTYSPPAAADDVDRTAVASCLPTSGSGFGLGVTTITCTAQDAAGNAASRAFTVTVRDTTPPVLTVPADISTTATLPSGVAVAFSASAADLVDGAASAICSPVSGSIFPAGVTTVQCRSTDRAGNSAAATFRVTVTFVPPPPDGRIFGIGHIDDRGKHHHFLFRVSQIRNYDFGRFEYFVRESRFCGRDDDDYADRDRDGDHDRDYGRGPRRTSGHFEATSITSVVFSDDPGFTPGRPGLRPRVDSATFVGTGKWNGKPGYTFTAAATDQGEPGRRHDTFSLVIKDAHGTVVASVNGELDGGNIQSTRLRGGGWR